MCAHTQISETRRLKFSVHQVGCNLLFTISSKEKTSSGSEDGCEPNKNVCTVYTHRKLILTD